MTIYIIIYYKPKIHKNYVISFCVYLLQQLYITIYIHVVIFSANQKPIPKLIFSYVSIGITVNVIVNKILLLFIIHFATTQISLNLFLVFTLSITI